MSGSSLARGVYKQLRAHDKALSAQALKARERGQAAADAAAALQARACSCVTCVRSLTRNAAHALTAHPLSHQQRANPWEGLALVGHASPVVRSDEHYAACQRPATLLRWCGREDTLIDRHDARGLLDEMALSGLPSRRAPPQQSDDAAREEHLAAYERYRDLVRLLRRGYGAEEQARGLALVAQEALARRVAAVGHTAPTARGLKAQAHGGHGAGAAPVGAYAAVGFSYGAGAAAADDDEDGAGDDDDGGSSSADSDDSQDAAAASAAAACGILDLGWHVRAERRRRAEEEERSAHFSGRPRITVKDVRRTPHTHTRTFTSKHALTQHFPASVRCSGSAHGGASRRPSAQVSPSLLTRSHCWRSARTRSRGACPALLRRQRPASAQRARAMSRTARRTARGARARRGGARPSPSRWCVLRRHVACAWA
jgi:hypothetical protein